MKRNQHHLFFYSYLALLCWLPIPLASKSGLAQGVFISLISLLSCLYCREFLVHKTMTIPIAARKAGLVYVFFVLHLLWVLVQVLPIPTDWVAFVSPVRMQFWGFDSGVDRVAISFNAGRTWRYFLLGAAYFQLFVLTLFLVDSVDRLKALLYVLLVLGVAQAVYGGLMTLSGAEMQLWYAKEAHIGVATGTLLNRNHLANYLMFCIAAGIGLLLSQTTTGSLRTWREWLRSIIQWLIGVKGFIRISIILMVIGMVLTRSRMGSVAFFSALTIASLLWLVLARKLNRTTIILFVSLLLIDLILVGSWFGIDKVAERLENTNSEIELRHQMLPYVLAMAKDFWIAGVGAGNFADTFPLYKQIPTMGWYNEAHCDYLQFLIEHGVIGVLPLLIIVFFSLIKTIQTICYRHVPLLVATGFTVLMAFIATGIHASVEYTLQRPATASLFVIFLALPWVTAHMESENSSRHRRSKPI